MAKTNSARKQKNILGTFFVSSQHLGYEGSKGGEMVEKKTTWKKIFFLPWPYFKCKSWLSA